MAVNIGVNGVPKNVSNIWVGVNGVPKKVKNAWIGVNGVPKVMYTTLGTPYISSVNHSGYTTWSSVTGASSYVVEKYDSSNSTWYSGTTASTNYTFNVFNTNVKKLRVTAKNAEGITKTSNEYSVNWVKITFNANGGSCSTSSYDRISGEEIGDLPTATRSGYTFDYWTAGSTSGSRVYSTAAYSGNMTLYAHWTSSVVNYTVTFNANGGTLSSGTPSSKSVTSGTTLSLSSYSASKSSTTSNGYKYTYTFKGWYTASSGGTKVTSATITSNVTYYAQYTSSSSLILQTPSIKSISGKTVTWTATTGASRYKVYKNGNTAGTAAGSKNYSSSYTTNTSITFGSSSNMYEVWVVAEDAYGHTTTSARWRKGRDFT